MTNNLSKYPLLPFSQLVYDMTRWMSGIYVFCVTFVWRGGAKEMERVSDAIRRALANHPVFSMRVDRHAQHYEAPLIDVLHGRYHDVNLYISGNDLYAKVRFDRILGDGVSIAIAFKDVALAYSMEPLRSDDYWNYLSHYEDYKNGNRFDNSKRWLESEFSDDSIPVRPTIDRRWLTTLCFPKAGLYEEEYTLLREKIDRLRIEQTISYEGVFSLCAALAIADYCGTDEAALTWAYEGREREDEQHIFGSLHRDVPFHIRKSKIDSREAAIREARSQIRSGIAHSDYPYTLTAPYTKRWNYAVNVLRVPDLSDYLSLFPFPVEIAEMPNLKYAYALLDVEIVEHAETLHLRYRYSATHYKLESIQRFAALVRKYVEWLVESE